MKALSLKSMLIAAIAATGLVAGSAMAGPTMDHFLQAYDSGNSGKGSELFFFEDASGKNFNESDVKKPQVKPVAEYDEDAELWVINFAPNEPGYFLLKFGAGGTDTKLDTYVFENRHDLTQLVWSNEQVNFLSGGLCSKQGNNCDIGRLSHVSWVAGNGGGGTPGGGEVPEPASLALLGAGLVGMALRRRRG